MTEEQVTIRAATREDLDVVVRMNLLLAEETEGRALDEATVRGGVGAALGDPQKGTYWLACAGGRIVGGSVGDSV